MSPVDFRTEIDFTHAIRLADELGAEGAERAGRRVLERAEERVPYDRGTLAGSADLVEDDGSVAVGYRAEHARYVHAHPEWKFQHNRSGRWLEEAIDDHEELLDEFATTFRSGWPG